MKETEADGKVYRPEDSGGVAHSSEDESRPGAQAAEGCFHRGARGGGREGSEEAVNGPQRAFSAVQRAVASDEHRFAALEQKLTLLDRKVTRLIWLVSLNLAIAVATL